MKRALLLLSVFALTSCKQNLIQKVNIENSTAEATAPLSNATKRCISCHKIVTPGIVAQWQNSRHAKITVAQALKKPALERLISARKVPKKFLNVAVGCAECHTQHPHEHADTFKHNGFMVHVVVTPKDCATCHPAEVAQYENSTKAHAYANLMKNPVYHLLAQTVVQKLKLSDKGKLTAQPTNDEDFNTSCLKCHGSVVKVEGMREVKTKFGLMKFPILKGFPNHGVGRVNPDGSLGSCSACHTRHDFSMKVARNPQTCGECHKGPDVPAYKVYMVSKHAAVYKAASSSWNWDKPSLVVGKDFTAPTCATCHMSQLVDSSGNVIVRRTHNVMTRLPYRLFGIYATRHIRFAETFKIKNSQGLPLPYELSGKPLTSALIDNKTFEKRMSNMKKVCLSCHAQTLVNNHFKELKYAINYTNEQEKLATELLVKAWEEGLASKQNPFDEPIERDWVESWLFYSNSIRYGAAMAGQDYVTFANGKWQLGKVLESMESQLKSFLKTKPKKAKK